MNGQNVLNEKMKNQKLYIKELSLDDLKGITPIAKEYAMIYVWPEEVHLLVPAPEIQGKIKNAAYYIVFAFKFEVKDYKYTGNLIYKSFAATTYDAYRDYYKFYCKHEDVFFIPDLKWVKAPKYVVRRSKDVESPITFEVPHPPHFYPTILHSNKIYKGLGGVVFFTVYTDEDKHLKNKWEDGLYCLIIPKMRYETFKEHGPRYVYTYHDWPKIRKISENTDISLYDWIKWLR